MVADKSSTYCRLIAESFSTYLDRSLPASVEQEIGMHLEQCPECRQRLESMKALIAGLGRMGEVNATPELAWSIKRAVHRQANRETSRPVLRPIPFLASAALAAAVLVVVNINSLPENGSLDQPVTGSSGMQITQSPPLERYVLPTQVGSDIPGLFNTKAAAEDTTTRREPSRIRGARAVRF